MWVTVYDGRAGGNSGGGLTAEVQQATEPVLVYVWADWCGPCRLMTQILTEMAPVAGTTKNGEDARG